MAAPSETTWGSIVDGYGRIGIYVDVTSSTATQLKYKVQVWFKSKYSVSDTNNSFYYDHLKASGKASTSRGSRSISTTNDSGSGWSSTNEKKIYETSEYTIDRTTSSQNRYIYAKLSGVEMVSGTMYASKTYSIGARTSYTVTYNANGGSGAPANQKKYHGLTLTLSSTVPTRSDYTFVGWGSSADDTTPINQPGGNYTDNGAYTYYAIWKKTITLSYSANGGSGAPTYQSATIYNATTTSNFTLSSTKPTRTGYSFLGWSTSSTATASSYSPGGSITLSDSDTLYAVWKINTYTVSFNGNGGSGVPSSQTKTYGVTLTLSSTKPTRTGYTFLGWATSSAATSPTWTAGGSYTTNASNVLFAVWSVNKYYLDLNGYLDGNTASNISGYGTADVYVNGTLLKSGITDYYDQHAYGSLYEIKNIKANPGYTYNGVYLGNLRGNIGDSTVRVQLNFTINKYSIVYNVNGGVGSIGTQTKTHGTNITLSASVPTRSNYKFLGWSVSPNDTIPKYQPGDVFTVNANTTLYAVWERLGIAYINVGGTWKKGRIYVNDNGVWKTGLIFKNVNGVWKQGGV